MFSFIIHQTTTYGNIWYATIFNEKWRSAHLRFQEFKYNARCTVEDKNNVTMAKITGFRKLLLNKSQNYHLRYNYILHQLYGHTHDNENLARWFAFMVYDWKIKTSEQHVMILMNGQSSSRMFKYADQHLPLFPTNRDFSALFDRYWWFHTSSMIVGDNQSYTAD